MREFMLVLHFLGLAMSVGVGIVFLFLDNAAGKMEKNEAGKFLGGSYRVVMMGHIGLTVSIISGGYLMTPFWGTLGEMPMLIAKLVLVVIMLVVISLVTVANRKARQGDQAQIRKMVNWGRISLVTGLAIVILAVLVFR